MTTKPKARKFRIRRSDSLNHRAGQQPAGQPAEPAAPAADTVAKQPSAQDIASPQQVSVDAEIAAIRKEGLTGRQLRMARRIAQKHGLAPVSDFDSVRLLRQKGIDPFQRSNMLELVIAEGHQPQVQGHDAQLPQTVPVDQNLPSTELSEPDRRASEILKIQRDIARRRQRKQIALFSRLAFFVFLPTLIAAYYYAFIATPMYATKSEFFIEKASSKLPGGLGSMFAGTQLANSQDSIAVQGYLQSRDAMLRLDREHGFKAEFSKEGIDPIQGLTKNATNEQAYRLYRRHVKIGYDPSEGKIRLEVSTPDPAVSAEFSRALIKYAEEQVDELTSRLRRDQMKGARESYQKAEVDMRKAQQHVIDLQEKSQIISGDVEVQLLTSRISALEAQQTQDELTLEELEANSRPNKARVDPLKRRIQSIKDKIADFRAKLTQSSANGQSLARVSSELKVSQADLENRNLMMQAALQQLETARIEANRQVRYLSVSVKPIPPDEPTYPHLFQNTMLAFLVFAGIYLMLSLTASILREQVSG